MGSLAQHRIYFVNVTFYWLQALAETSRGNSLAHWVTTLLLAME
jgi:hypothetical protein